MPIIEDKKLGHRSRTILTVSLAVGTIFSSSRCTTVSEQSDVGLRAPSARSVAAASSRDLVSIEDPAVLTVVRYQAAMRAMNSNQPLAACEGFRSIALDSSSQLPEPVRLLAHFRALPVCPLDRQLPVIESPQWLAELAVRGRLSNLRLGPDSKALASALREVAPFEKTQKLRVERLTEALEILAKVEAREPQNQNVKNEIAATTALLVSFAPRFARGLKHDDPSVSQLDALAIPNDLRNAREFDLARGLYLEIAQDLERTDIERLRALDGIRMAYKLQRRTPEFIEASKHWQRFAADYFLKPGKRKNDPVLLKTYLDTRIQYARAIWTDHRSQEAKRILLQTEKQIGKSISVHESALIRSRIAEESKNYAESESILRSIAIDRLPDRATKARFLWYRGWNLRKIGTRDSLREAVSILEQAQTFEDRHTDLTRNMYWTARLHKELGEPEKARRLFSELADLSQFGFYGIIAQRELALPFVPFNSEINRDYDPLDRSPLADVVRVPSDWFAALGEFETGRRYLDSFPAKTVWDSAWSLSKKEAALEQLARLEQHTAVSARIDGLTPDERKTLLAKRPEFLFPLPYQARILEETARHELPPALIYSIMRQESLFNPFARSPADAFGLMQLIPENAKTAAKSLGLKLEGPEDLYDPDKNIALGTYFLKNLFKKYDDQFIFAVSGYNANDRAIQGWIKTRLRPDPLEFIEEIPYDETRLYVKLVIRNFVIYQRRLSSTPVEFPEKLLNINQTGTSQ